LTDRKKLNEVNKPLHSSTNPKILVKISPLDSEKQSVERRSLKKYLKIDKKTSAKYIHVAFSASLPSWQKIQLHLAGFLFTVSR